MDHPGVVEHLSSAQAWERLSVALERLGSEFGYSLMDAYRAYWRESAHDPGLADLLAEVEDMFFLLGVNHPLSACCEDCSGL